MAKVEHTCQRCGEKFWEHLSQKRKYCSHYCRQETHKVAQTCHECGAVFYKTDWHKPKYCSKACMDAFNRYRLEGDTVYLILTTRKREFVAETAIDAEDLDKVRAIGTRVGPRWDSFTQGYRASMRWGGKSVFLHRVVTDAPAGEVVDHLDHDTLNNRKRNLKVGGRTPNNQNRKGADRGSATGIRNVYFDKKNQNYQVKLVVGGKRINVGRFDNAEEAEQAAITARRKYMPSSTS